ncbi:MAG: glucose-1-phosphate adenylyltransferase [Nitrospirae bacterium GWC2_57_13]|jgi:glucose-1-phosphate adenylyltransferase|nr:MAG: glucose-1-phosphate adenylyltransferase [Nitrospirae bacterium GWC2_57_13]HAS55012.1 glucose-1-phosphate adenylyltransferase [Nitrospiraceae bacterium]
MSILAMILAGGKGERLHPLTLHRAKPAVPFGGIYRIIDFALSNCINSGIRKIAVLTQYKSLSLERHLRLGWNLFAGELNEYVISVPPQQRVSEKWYQGTADAIYQNIYMIEKDAPEHLLILAGDHIYKMDYSEMLRYHREKKAVATVAAIEVPQKDSGAFGIVEVDRDYRITGFEEKPKAPRPIPGKPGLSFASMGIYLFDTKKMIEYLEFDALRDTAHDFGRNIIPEMLKSGQVFAYDFKDENNKEAKYWRDVGTIDAYWEASMDLASVDPLLNLYNRQWPIRTYRPQFPPAKFVFAQEKKGGRLGIALDSTVSPGCIVSGGRVQNSVLSPNVRINSYSDVRESVLMENVEVGRHCRIRRAIIDKDVIIPPDTEVGYDPDEDRRRFYVSPGGIVVIPKGAEVMEELRSYPVEKTA